MKINKSVLSCAVVAALGASAQAQVNVTVTGSTAFRSVAFDRAVSLFDAGFTVQSNGVTTVTYQGTMSGSTSLGSATVTMRFSFSGSGTGTLAVKNSTPVPTLNPDGTTNTAIIPDLAFSDVYPVTAGVNPGGLDDNNIIGVIPFVWIRNNSLSGISNITRDQAVYLMGASGTLTKDYFTGIPADSGTAVYLTGRDSGSGTRLTTQADIGFTGTPVEVSTNASGQIITFGGFTSGGLERGFIAAEPGVIGYLGVSDAHAITNAATILSYNGVPFSIANVQNGSYGIWGYEHMINRTGGLSPNQTTVLNAYVAAITNPTYQTTNPLYTSAFADLANMLVSRQADGGPINQGN
jgi:hypothetical protein